MSFWITSLSLSPSLPAFLLLSFPLRRSAAFYTRSERMKERKTRTQSTVLQYNGWKRVKVAEKDLQLGEALTADSTVLFAIPLDEGRWCSGNKRNQFQTHAHIHTPVDFSVVPVLCACACALCHSLHLLAFSFDCCSSLIIIVINLFFFFACASCVVLSWSYCLFIIIQ